MKERKLFTFMVRCARLLNYVKLLTKISFVITMFLLCAIDLLSGNTLLATAFCARSIVPSTGNASSSSAHAGTLTALAEARWPLLNESSTMVMEQLWGPYRNLVELLTPDGNHVLSGRERTLIYLYDPTVLYYKLEMVFYLHETRHLDVFYSRTSGLVNNFMADLNGLNIPGVLVDVHRMAAANPEMIELMLSSAQREAVIDIFRVHSLTFAEYLLQFMNLVDSHYFVEVLNMRPEVCAGIMTVLCGL